MAPLTLTVAEELAEAFPGLRAELLVLGGITVRARSSDLDRYKDEVIGKLTGVYNVETVKDEERIRAYRDFFWRVGIDPTKIRPAAEALLRRVLQGKPVPTINTLVDAYNLASMETRVALAAFDLSTVEGDLVMRFAHDGEQFHGIGMEEPITLRGKEVVVEDERQLVAVYPYRDADHTKVTTQTKDVVLMVCGVPGLDREALPEASDKVAELITRFCGGPP